MNILDIFTSAPWFVWLIIGFGAGVLFYACVERKSIDGVIHVKQGEEKDNYLFEFRIPPETIPKMDQVVFDVLLEDDESQNLQSTI